MKDFDNWIAAWEWLSGKLDEHRAHRDHFRIGSARFIQCQVDRAAHSGFPALFEILEARTKHG